MMPRRRSALAVPTIEKMAPPLCKGKLGAVAPMILYLPAPLLTKEGNQDQVSTAIMTIAHTPQSGEGAFAGNDVLRLAYPVQGHEVGPTFRANGGAGHDDQHIAPLGGPIGKERFIDLLDHLVHMFDRGHDLRDDSPI